MIVRSKLPVLWALMSDQHKCYKAEIQQDDHSSGKKKSILFFVKVCPFVLESDSMQREEGLLPALGLFSQ